MTRSGPSPASPSLLRARVSRQRRQEAVGRLVQGETPGTVAREVGVPVETLVSWTAEFAAGGTAASVRPGAVDDAGTRGAVIGAAIHQFAEKGFAGARIDEIAAEAGVNKTAIYYHYGNKEDLFAAALELGYSRFQASWRSVSGNRAPALARLENFLGAIFDGLLRNREHASLIADENRLGGQHLSPALKLRIRGFIDPLIQELTAIIASGQQEGVFKPNVDVLLTYLSLISLSMFYLTHSSTLSVSIGIDLMEAGHIRRWRQHVIDVVTASVR